MSKFFIVITVFLSVQCYCQKINLNSCKLHNQVYSLIDSLMAYSFEEEGEFNKEKHIFVLRMHLESDTLNIYGSAIEKSLLHIVLQHQEYDSVLGLMNYLNKDILVFGQNIIRPFFLDLKSMKDLEYYQYSKTRADKIRNIDKNNYEPGDIVFYHPLVMIYKIHNNHIVRMHYFFDAGFLK